MYKFFKMIVLTLLTVLSLQQAALASMEVKRPPKPTEGIESFNLRYGSSTDINTGSVQRATSLFYSYYCSITNTGTDLYLEGTTSSNYLADQLGITLYLQKWDGSQWVDIRSWPFTKYNARSIREGARLDYQPGNYYRTRASHYIKYGSQSETQYSTSSYIYIE